MTIVNFETMEGAQVLVALGDPQRLPLQVRHDLVASGIEVVEAGSGPEVLQRFRTDVPSCSLIDLLLPPSGGLDTLAELLRRRPAAPVLMFGEAPSSRIAIEAMRLGAKDLLDLPVDPLLLQTRVLQLLSRDRQAIAAERACADRRRRIAALSRRERQVLELVLQGLSNKETARVLEVSPKAIEIYRAGMMRKLGHRSSVVMAAWVSQCPDCVASLFPSDIPMPGQNETGISPHISVNARK